MSRSYGQLCGLALALDAVGDRWSLLIVRELLVRDGARYTDLRDGLPGIATNLLAERLRTLEDSGIVVREDPRPPVATGVFRLTDRGRALRPAVDALALWGGDLVPASDADAEFRSRWLVIPIEAKLTDNSPADTPVTLAVRTGDEPVRVEIGAGHVRARTGSADQSPDAVIAGPPKAVLGVIAGKLPPTQAAALGVRVSGNPAVLARAGIVWT